MSDIFSKAKYLFCILNQSDLLDLIGSSVGPTQVMILGTDQNDHDLIMKNLFFTVKPVLIDNLILLMTVIIRRNLTWSGTSNVSEFCFSQPSPNVELSLLKKELS